MARQNRSSGSKFASKTPVKTARNLSRDALVDIVARIQGRMYLDLDDAGGEFWNPGKQWSCADVCQDIQDILHRHGHVPGEEQPFEEAVSGAERDIAQLVELAEASGVEPGDLDDIVHECAAATAGAINNSGLCDQLEYLLDQLGLADTNSRLSEVADTRGNSAPSG